MLVGERPDLLGGTVDEHDADTQRPQQRDVEQQRRQAVVDDDAGIDREDEGLLAKLRNVLKNASKVGQLHVSSSRLGHERPVLFTVARVQGAHGVFHAIVGHQPRDAER